MDIKIQGGKSIKGEVETHGAKNCVTKELVASLLTSSECVLENVPDIIDVSLTLDMITALGGKVERKDRSCVVRTSNIKLMKRSEIDSFSGKSRVPILLCGPLLARLGEVFVPSLGGCNIGPRPIDFHINALKSLGAIVEENEDGLYLKADGLMGAKIALDYPSVGATEQVLLSSVLAKGKTVLSNAAVEPEIIDLVSLLQKMGAEISVDTDRQITIVGVEKLHGYRHVAMPDRLEAVSWACAAIATGGEVLVKDARQKDMITFLNKYRQIGGGFEVRDNGIKFWRETDIVKPVFIETDVHPGFMTDWQQPFVVVLTQADGVSVVHETVYENRFGFTETLNKMGAKIQLYRDCLGGMSCRFGQRNYLHSAVIVGRTPLKAGKIVVPDLRAGFSYIIAALIAKGVSQIQNINIIERGYEDFVGKLTSLGVDVCS